MQLPNVIISGTSGLVTSLIIVILIGAIDIIQILFMPIFGIAFVSSLSGALIKPESKISSALAGSASSLILCFSILMYAMSYI